ncbi:hypothetical protein C477_05892 [Haloterrigena salina JCM 13891]|uniref:Uncharacterized protein n=1 Tax=Haloterrigena salina JCM 13891 TaxID=1227488 RepID=M0CCM3_9EURY|nr:hypothetical protein C477_05892 [Haloterrigena salina JCM 13891]
MVRKKIHWLILHPIEQVIQLLLVDGEVWSEFICSVSGTLEAIDNEIGDRFFKNVNSATSV